MEFRTDLSSRIILAVCMWPIAGVGIYGALDGDIFSGSILAVGATVAWLYYATLRVVFANDLVVVRRFGRVVWSARVSDVTAHYGLGGEAKTHTALILEAPHKRGRFEVVKTLFGYDAMVAIARLLGVNVSPPRTIF